MMLKKFPTKTYKKGDIKYITKNDDKEVVNQEMSKSTHNLVYAKSLAT